MVCAWWVALAPVSFGYVASHGVPARTTGYTYNPNGSLETVAYANGVTHTYGYDALNRLRTLNVAQTAGLGAVLHTYDYRLTASGHRHQVIEGSKTTIYDYDELYRLSGETITGAPSGQNGVVGYGLDKVGNRLNRMSSIAEITAQLGRTYNSRDQLAGDVYDLNGNTQTGVLSGTGILPVGSSVTEPDVYDFEDRLIVRTKPDGSTINLSYDADGLRRQKTILNSGAQLVSTTHYLLDTNNLTGYAQVVEESTTDATGTTLKTYTYGSDLINRSVSLNAQPSTLNYYIYDGGGSVRELTDETGSITDRYTYDAFGVLIAQVGTSDNAYLYRGEHWDADLGLYYLRARFMNPDSGRFWNQDSYEGSNGDPMSLNKYIYANADPVGHMDPSGQFSLVEAQAVMADIVTLGRMAMPVIRVVNTARSIVNMMNLVAGYAKLIQSGDLEQWLGQITQEIGRIKGQRGIGFSGEEAAMQFGMGFAQAAPLALLWAPELVADLETGAKFTGYTIFGPNIPGVNMTANFPSGLKVGGYPVTLAFGGKFTGRLAGLGIQTERGGKKINHLFYRMDIHKPELGHGNPGGVGTQMKAKDSELMDPWIEYPFHFHVMKYSRNN